MEKIRISWVCLLGMMVLFGAAPATLFSATSAPCSPALAKVVSVQGLIEARRAGQTRWEPARLDDEYCEGDLIRVGERSRADIALANQPVLRLDQHTTIMIGGVSNETSLIEMIRGAVYFFSREPRNLNVKTPFVNAGVEGTEGLITVAANLALISIFEGMVRAENAFGNLTLNGGQSAIAEQGQAPRLEVIVRPRDAVQWAIYYVPTLYYRSSDFPAVPGWQEMVRKSIDAYQRREFTAAFDAIRNAPTNLNEAGFFTYRAALLLAVGRVDEANRDIDEALRLRANYSDATALRAIIAVVQNEKERALETAKQSVTADPKSASALIALSYAQQANFDLDAALNSLQRAVELDPQNPLAWARLTELWLSFSRLDDALEAAQKAVSIDPNLSRTQTMLGFAYLTRIQTAEAKQAFVKAIELDQADGLPRLGLGLARIREGELVEGRREIEIAVSLDPDNALYRSYSGKAFFEEKRDKQAAQQYEMSKKLDPKDPTPYFYDAIRKQTTNRPVEALQDMGKAIELNNNRAVYRSSLQLDSDLAARSASLGRIYSDLGFQQLALVEGWKSVNIDPTNFSAHRLLADSYSILPRHEIARVSELLQSQLLQPLNTTPIQPRLGESNLSLISAGGPAGLSSNEFHPLFNRNGINFQSTGLAGENHTYAGEGVLSGIYKNVSFSLGGFHFQTDGWRTNSDQDDAIANAFLQLELSPKTSVQGEVRYRNRETGEIRLRFAPDDFVANRRHEERAYSVRLGLHHAFTPDSRLIGHFGYFNSDRGIRHIPRPFDIFIDLKGEDEAFGGEIQHLFRSANLNIVSGLGHVNINANDIISTKFSVPPSIIPIDQRSNNLDVLHSNLYFYTYTHLQKNLTLVLGGSGDFVTRELRVINQFNPKFGLIWSPFPFTTIRGAVFRTLKRTLIINQTLEPTHVAGFNQFFDDGNGTSAWRYGIAVDQKFSSSVFGGVEYSFRDLEVPFFATAVSGFKEEVVGWNERLFRFYLFWTPWEWLAISGGYDQERLRRDKRSANGTKRVETHRIPIGVNFFHTSGWSASLKAIYTGQRGEFQRLGSSIFDHGRNSFWAVDAALNYRLPNRHGFVTIGVSNLFDKKFRHFDTDFGAVNINPRVIPDRVIFGRLTLAFP